MSYLQGGSPGVSPYQLFPAVACLLSTIDESHIRKTYEGYQVIRVNITNKIAFDTLKRLYIGENYDFWSVPSMNHPADIFVSPEQNQTLLYVLNSVNAEYSVLQSNIQEMVQLERSHAVSLRTDAGAMNWESYQTVETIHAWMDKMAEQYPALVTVTTFGNSTEGRPMKVMKISTAGPSSNRSAVWIDSGIHAREWITPAVATFIANKLILQATRERNHRLVDSLDWYIAPSMNPDGYAFTMVGDRLWRKTRSIPDKQSSFGGLFGCCKGADPNRNWDYQWGGKGTSNHQCSQIYRGPTAASEPEVASAQKFIYSIKDQVKLFLTFHSYSQLILLPWCYDNVRTDDYEDLLKVANKAAAVLESHYGTKYKVGATAELLYAAAGGSFDWAKGTAGIKYAYAFELRDTGRYGFLLPPNQIVPTGEETFSAVKSMAEDVMKAYRIDSRIQSSQSGHTFYEETKA